LWELLRIICNKIQPLRCITFAFLDLGFSSSRLRRFGPIQSKKILHIRSPPGAAIPPDYKVEAFLDALDPRGSRSVRLRSVQSQYTRAIHNLSADENKIHPGRSPPEGLMP
jgi:hypothetical protein